MTTEPAPSAPTYDEVAAALTAVDWTYAKTMPQWPHWYTLREDWKADVDFEAVVLFIRDNGYRETFKPTGNTFTRLNVGLFKYWSMGAPLKSTILINSPMR